MAEGGGTAAWLAHLDGNSSHYVVEYRGTIVQMVPELEWAGSLNPRLIRQDDDKPYTYGGERITYGRSAARAALGLAPANDPNRYVIAIEIEGFAKIGPSAKQSRVLADLVNDIRRRRGVLPALGHRDFQSYKACPGHLIDWPRLGGHAARVAYAPPPAPPPAPTTEVDVLSFDTPKVPSVCDVPTGSWLYTSSALLPNADNVSVSPGRTMPYLGATPDAAIVQYVDAQGAASGRAYYVHTADATNIRPAPADCAPVLEPVQRELAQALANLAKIHDISAT